MLLSSSTKTAAFLGVSALALARDSCASNPQTYNNPTNDFIENGTPNTNGTSILGKRGLSFHDASLTNILFNDSAVTWAYN
jgi:hypothetical protein